jgi:hypothetical protein
MNRLSLAILLIGLLLAPDAARGGGIYGPSGLFLHPTGYLLPGRRPLWGVTYFTQRGAIGAGRETVTWVPVFVDQRLGKRWEGGLVFLHQRASGQDRTSYGGFAKYQLGAEQRRRPAIALAVDDLSGDLRSASGYLIASKQLVPGPRAIRAHLGYVVTRRDDLTGPMGRFHQTDSAPFAGIELFFSPTLELVGEIEARMRFYERAPMSVGLTWHPSRRIGLGIGWLNTGRSTTPRFFIGIGYKTTSVD